MLRKLGLGIAYFIAVVYIMLIVWPAVYCLQHAGCKGPGELDAFMPAFMLTPIGIVATGFSLHNAIRSMRKRQAWSWLFGPLAVVFSIVLLGAASLIVMIIYYTVFHRFHS